MISKMTCILIDYIFDGMVFFSLLLQTLWSLMSLTTNYDILNYKTHKKYMNSKILLVFINFMKIFLKPKIIAIFTNHESKEYVDYNDAIIMVDLIWTIIDIYFVILLYSTIRTRVLNKGYNINQYQIDQILIGNLIRAIDIDINGVKTNKEIIDKEIEIGALFDTKEEKIQIPIKFSGKKFFIDIFKKFKNIC